jgi:hypothetical protein
VAKSPLSLQRLLNTPELERIVTRLPPAVLHRVVRHYGLEDCTELIALATPEQVARLLDEDLWHSHAGSDAAFDTERFGLWIAVLMQSGAGNAADKLAGIETGLVIAGLAGHIAAFDRAAVSAYTTLDGDFVEGRASTDARMAEIGGYLLEARRAPAWDAIVELLSFLDLERPDYFGEVMRGCVRLSNGAAEADGFHDLLADGEQASFDVSGDREERRAAVGHLTPAQARAFLLNARTLRRDSPAPPVSASARAYFRALEGAVPAAAIASERRVTKPGEAEPPAAQSSDIAETVNAAAVAAFIDLLSDAGVLQSEPRRLLAAASTGAARLGLLQEHVASHDSAAEELAYLANVLLEGSAVDGRTFSPQEAADAAAATSNLGLEYWPGQWERRDLITAFQLGWQVLNRDVCVFTTACLSAALAALHCHDRDLQLQIAGLRTRLAAAIARDAPWHVRTDLDVLLMLDAVSWVVVRGLIAECPVMNRAIRLSGPPAIRAEDFDFIASSADISAVRQFGERLPGLLTR